MHSKICQGNGRGIQEADAVRLSQDQTSMSEANDSGRLMIDVKPWIFSDKQLTILLVLSDLPTVILGKVL